MKLPSFKIIAGEALKTVRRFPLVMLVAVVGSIAGIYFIHGEFSYNTSLFFKWQKIILVAILTVPLLCTISFAASKKSLNSATIAILNIVILAVMIIYFFLFKRLEAHYTAYILYIICSVLLVSYSAYIRDKNEQGWWQFNKILLMRAINSLFFSGALYLGLALAVAAINKLFNADWSGRVYGYIFTIVFGIFNTWYFLSGMPEDYEEVDKSNDYPKILKLFAQYILIPLAIIYLTILYAYEIKILFQWSLPIGWVSSLILTYAAVGLLAILLVYPLKDEEGKAWVKMYSKLFFVLLYPLIVLLALAISRRISDYGITESRYFLIVLTIWLAVITLYYTFSKKRSIKAVTVSLMFLSFIVSFGPWGAFSISENSQIHRFMNILKERQAISGGKIVESKKITNSDVDHLKSIIHYLKETHGLTGLVKNLKSVSDIKFARPIDSISTANILDGLKIDSTLRFQYAKSKIGRHWYNIAKHINSGINITGYQLYIVFGSNGYKNDNKEQKYKLDDQELKVLYNKELGIIEISLNKEKIDLIDFNMKDIFKQLSKKDEEFLKFEDFKVLKENNRLKVLLLTDFLEGEYHNTEKDLEINNFTLELFVSLK